MSTNALLNEKSPYLRQHAHNPVNWFPWGEAAFHKAKSEQKPIFLSIGYSTCHWCHVMAHESFEDEQIAEILNRDFVPVKVDREERPDVDRIYMLFVQASTGSGGWPMSVWLTPDLKPFFGGTYFPPNSRYGRPGFKDVLEHLANAWRRDRQQIESSGARVMDQLQSMTSSDGSSSLLDRDLFESPFWQFRRMYDSRWGGFGAAPKFPRPAVFHYLLRYYAASQNSEALEMVVQTLRHMAAGGMHDQIGGGFHRYSVDERWFVPHFEKMLYDQAQLATTYLEAYQITHDEDFARVARDIFAYVQRDLRDTQGAFYSAEDADSPDPEHPGHSGEGAFYIWRRREIEQVLGTELAEVFSRHYGVKPDGNVDNDPQGEFTGRNILYQALSVQNRSDAAGLADASARLLRVRAKRPRPHLDNKVLTSWNALMISAFAKGYRVLGDTRYKQAAQEATEFIFSRMYGKETRTLQRRFCDGEAAVLGFLDDYAFLAQSQLDMFEITFEVTFLERAIELAKFFLAHFEDTSVGGFFSTLDAPDLLMKLKDDYDGAEPSGNSIATEVLLRLAHLTGNAVFSEPAVRALRAASARLRSQPATAPQLMSAVGSWLAGPSHVVIRCQDLDAEAESKLRDVWKEFEPNVTTLVVTDSSAPELAAFATFLKTLERKGRITTYRCVNFTCELPDVVL
jgi:uncharacterized protein YyaL (SSP411 family)